MLDLSTIDRCADITDTHVIQAARSREDMRALLMHAAHISRPSEGASKVLLALARLAMSSVDWIDGDLRVDLVAADEQTNVEVKSVSGGVIERVFPLFTLDAPLDEFVRAVRLVPRMIEPLVMHAQSEGHLVFLSSDELYDELPPESVEVSGGSVDAREEDFGSLLDIEVGTAIPESEIEKPTLKGSRPAFDPDVHTRKTTARMAAISREALRSDVPPATTPTRPAPPPRKKPTAGEEPEKVEDEFDEGWE